MTDFINNTPIFAVRPLLTIALQATANPLKIKISKTGMAIEFIFLNVFAEVP
jgi:ABC-type nitrate/sulfonate/bicarbonate transport system permease component